MMWAVRAFSLHSPTDAGFKVKGISGGGRIVAATKNITRGTKCNQVACILGIERGGIRSLAHGKCAISLNISIGADNQFHQYMVRTPAVTFEWYFASLVGEPVGLSPLVVGGVRGFQKCWNFDGGEQASFVEFGRSGVWAGRTIRGSLATLCFPGR
jgi:hypothetical protein